MHTEIIFAKLEYNQILTLFKVNNIYKTFFLVSRTELTLDCN